MLFVKVLGPGCENCRKVEAIARQAVANLGIKAQVEKITDHTEMEKYAILTTPGLVVNEKLVCVGRIPNETEVMNWLANSLGA